MMEYNEKIDLTELGNTVLEFYTPSCVNCRIVKKLLEMNEEALGVRIITVDATLSENAFLVKQYDVMSAPKIVLIQNTKDQCTTNIINVPGKSIIEQLRHYLKME